MTDPHCTALGETMEELLERVVFASPATRAIREEWEKTKRIEREVYERVCREEYECRLDYHHISQSPNPEEVARRETDFSKQLHQKELEQRLAERWSLVLRQVETVLAGAWVE